MSNKFIRIVLSKSIFSTICKILCFSSFCVFASSAFSAAYEKQESDYGHKTVYFREYKIEVKQGSDYKTGKSFQYKEGYLIYSETPVGTIRVAACLANICEKWTNEPNSFKQYEDKRAKIKTDERLADNDQMEECIIEIKLIKK